jgi:chloramphenicol-sensitive protein RarD
MSQTQRGVVAMVLTCVVWGLSSLFYKLLSPVPPLEVLCHRTLWSLVFFLLILGPKGRLGEIVACLSTRRMMLVTLGAALTISANWFGFIHSVQIGRAMEASLGYYIFPLVAVVLGMLVFGDRLRPLQWLAVALATAAVLVLTIGLHVVPVVSLFLAGTFGIYGVLKRRMPAAPMASVAAEVTLLAPFALVWLALAHGAGWSGVPGRTGGFFLSDPWLTLLLVLAGPLTGLPLMMFSYATQRLPLPTIGLIQYLNPTLQFLCATLVFGEAFTPWHAIAFPMIWTALALYSFDGWRSARASGVAELTATGNPDTPV